MQISKASLGAGICSKCRWSHACKDCDEEKTWMWTIRIHLGVGRKPAAKAKGRPKGKAKATAIGST